MSSGPVAKLKCAVYTRKSSEEGLEQSFNSLHAQRESCEAYIKSQAGEGWRLLATPYDDGGFSGGNTDRPALKRLLADIERGAVDVVVVYKVDRLTRSLADFAKMVETFDGHGVSFVSVTQAFNTTTSMGRLTLNVLLSFAQFEREVTGERIRDKIAASKVKGLWMGGILPLGYDSREHMLVVNEVEAQTVRWVFTRYLELSSVHALESELAASAVRSKSWVTSRGRAMGGKRLSRGALYHLLQNRHYRGEIRHKDKTYPGLHSAIVEEELFDAVQRTLAQNRVVRRDEANRTAKAPLVGLIFDGEGRPYTPSFARGRGGKTYRYYIAAAGEGSKPRRIPADELESFLLDLVRRLIDRPALEAGALRESLRRVELRPASLLASLPLSMVADGEHPDLAIEVLRARLNADERAVMDGDEELVRISVPTKLTFRGGQTWLTGIDPSATTPRRRANQALVKGLRASHVLLAELQASPLAANGGFRAAKPPATTYLTRLAKLAFLAPQIQQDILAGRQPRGLSVKQLLAADIPLSWEDQRSWLRTL